jgi:hypothetical protein
MDKNIFCFVEETPNYKYRFFSRILLVNSFHKEAKCIIVCSEETKKFIENFPLSYDIKLVFIPNIFNTYNLIYTFTNILKVLWYAITHFGHGIYIYDNLMMVHKMVIPESIKSQGYGFHKKVFNSHDEENNKKRYSFEVIYASNKEFIKTVEDMLGIPNLHRKKKITDKHIEILKEHIDLLEFNVMEKLKTQYFLDYEVNISTEDFFSFNNEVKLSEITYDFIWKEKKITFLNLRLERNAPPQKTLHSNLLQMLIKYNRLYSHIIHFSNATQKINFILPFKKNISIWDRQKDGPGLYAILENFYTLYPEYCSITKKGAEYFSVSTLALTDKPSHHWMTKELYLHYEMLLCNYDKSLLKTVKKDSKLKYSFLFYYFDDPLYLDEYFWAHKDCICDNERTTLSLSLKSLKNGKYSVDSIPMNSIDEVISLLIDTKYVFLSSYTMSLMVLCFALGCVPVFAIKTKSLGFPLFELEENKHYCIHNIYNNNNNNNNYDTMRSNILTYYETSISPKNTFKKLVNHLFIRNVE